MKTNKHILAVLFAVLIGTFVQAQSTKIISIDTKSPGRIFDGIGSVSAGGTSRLLIDYPEPYRSQVLDYLFKPYYGAGFQHLKVEPGGDFCSGPGSEPSYARTLDEFTNPKPEYFERGFEWWLMEEAVKRDSSIILDCLQWTAPDWVRTAPGKNSLCSKQNADYLASFLKGARKYHNLNISLVGIWNESPYDVQYIKLLRKTLDENNLKQVKIVAADQSFGGDIWGIATQMKNDPELAKAVGYVSAHYPGYAAYLGYLRFDAFKDAPKPEFSSTQAAKDCGKPIWASEHGPWRDDWKGACELARIYNRNYIDGKMTRTEIWSPVSAYYDILLLPRSGVIRANSPWSGNYVVCPTVWATAHTTQFAKPGWRYLDNACGYLYAGGSFVSLLSPKDSDFSTIIETIESTVKQEVEINIASKFKGKKVYLWRTSDKDDPSKWFQKVQEMIPVNGSFTINLEPNSIYSVTTTTGQRKGDTVPPPLTQLAMPFVDDFSSYAVGKTPKYFSDQVGAFEIATAPTENKPFLCQVITKSGIIWGADATNQPYTLMGDSSWTNYQVEIDAFLVDSGEVRLYGRATFDGWGEDEQPESYFLRVRDNGSWQLCKAFNRNTDGPYASPELKIPNKTFIVIMDEGKPGSIPVNAGSWFRMGLRLTGKRIIATINNKIITNFIDTNVSSKGLMGLGSGWGQVRFANLKISAVNP